jgi:hypothetical protein
MEATVPILDDRNWHPGVSRCIRSAKNALAGIKIQSSGGFTNGPLR